MNDKNNSSFLAKYKSGLVNKIDKTKKNLSNSKNYKNIFSIFLEYLKTLFKFIKNLYKKSNSLIKYILLKKLKAFHLKRSFKLRDYLFLLIFALGLIFSFIFLTGPSLLPQYFQRVPVEGGTLEEAVIGFPQNINPLYTYPNYETSNKVDDTLVSLIYSSPLKVNLDGKYEYDAIKDLTIEDNGKVYILEFRDNIKFHDGEKLTIEDVLFTTDLLKNNDYNPSQNSVNFWNKLKIETIEENKIKITQPEKTNVLDRNLTFGILPKHIWSEVGSGSFRQNKIELAIGSGPYKIKKVITNKLNEITKIILSRNDIYTPNKAIIDNIEFTFFESLEKMEDEGRKLKNYNYGFFQKPEDDSNLKIFKGNKNLINSTIYYSLFFNMKANTVWQRDLDLRNALLLAINKDKIINDVFNNNAQKVNWAIPKNSEFYKQDLTYSNYDTTKAQELFAKAGWKNKNEDNYLVNDKDEKLTLKITIHNEASSVILANIIQEILKKEGVSVEIIKMDSINWTNDVLKNRKYDVVLTGQSLETNFDLYSFWHSSQIASEGYNLSQYKNNEIDKQINITRTTNDIEKKKEAFYKIQEIIQKNKPALFLVSPYYVYLTNSNLKNNINTKESLIINDFDRFFLVEDWSLKDEIQTKK